MPMPNPEIEKVLTAPSSSSLSSSSSTDFSLKMSDLGFQETLNQVQELCDNVDPEKEPFRSKYKARDLLESLKIKLLTAFGEDSLGQMSIQSMEEKPNGKSESKNEDHIRRIHDEEKLKEVEYCQQAIHDENNNNTVKKDRTECDKDEESKLDLNVPVKKEHLMIASCDYRIGKIGLETEEYHTAEKYLSKAIQIFLPTLLKEIDQIFPADYSLDDEKENKSHNDYEILEPPSSSWPVNVVEGLRKDEVDHSFLLSCYEDILDMLNQIGILWYNRGNSQRALLFLLSSKIIYEKCQENQIFLVRNNNRVNMIGYSTHTHTLFYLAQVYGGLNISESSAKYCILTLERQLPPHDILKNSTSDERNINNNKFDPFAWCKNCLGLFEYFITVRNSPLDALTTLLAVEEVLKYTGKEILPGAEEKGESLKSEPQIDPEEIQLLKADIQRRYAHFYSWILKKAFDEQLNFAYNGSRLDVDSAPELAASKNEFTIKDVKHFRSLIEDSDKGKKEIAEIAKYIYLREDELESDGIANRLKDSQELGKDKVYFTITSIRDFDQAREIFLKLMAALQKAADYFILDGFVTDHVNLCIQQSQAYRYLIIFEKEEKRRIAMYLRRVGLLKTPLNEISRTAYVGLHKSLSFEIGEIYMELLDLKISRIEAKQKNHINSSSTFPKKSEIEKVNEYCSESIRMNEHFISLYVVDDEDKGSTSSTTGSFVDEGKENGGATKKKIKVDKDELLPLLRSHFHLARLYGRVNIYGNIPERVEATKKCLEKYEWLYPFAKQKIVEFYSEENKEFEKEGAKTVFQEELMIMSEMIKILPEKINRMVHHGQRFSI